MRCPTRSEISFIERLLQTPGISERRHVNYRIWLFIVQWELGNGDKFEKAGEKFLASDSEGPARKQKAYRSYKTVEKSLRTGLPRWTSHI